MNNKKFIWIGIAGVLVLFGIYKFITKTPPPPKPPVTHVTSVTSNLNGPQTFCYKFTLNDISTHKVCTVKVSVNGGPQIVITATGNNGDNINWLPCTVTCPVTNLSIPIVFYVYDATGAEISSARYTLTDILPSCDLPNIVTLSGIPNVCSGKVRNKLGYTSTISVQVSEPTNNNYNQLVTWPPTRDTIVR